MTVLISRVSGAEDIPAPAYITERAAAMDVYANVREPLTLDPGRIAAVPLGFRIALPEGFEAQIRARSGLALRHGVACANGIGTIDADYRGEVRAILINLGFEPFVIHRADRVAQMTVNRVERAELCWADELPGSVRGEGGFGSTGIR
ncbi:MAG: dUTP diphosphatase [Clostridiales bacterium]|jgi:dUTP pyrophosphatase|nr:dUTP diphosphatase [Clostridiales bacterium]